MPRPKSGPTYCVHKRSGHAYVTIDGRQIPLGKANTPESRAAYDRVIGEWFSNGRKLPQPVEAADPSPLGPTVSVVIEAFWAHAEGSYTEPVLDAAGQPVTNEDGTPKRVPARELDNYRQALRPLRRMYGATPALDFGCAQLEALRAAAVRPHKNPDSGQTVPGWSRKYANRQVSRIKHVFGWAVTKGLVPASVHEALLRLPGLRAGKSDAREAEPVRPVDEGRALAIVPHVSRQVGAMIRVQLLTGMRSTEVCIMRPRDIDRTRTPWVYKPASHKTAHHGIAREIPIGPRAREVLGPFLEGRDPDAYLFSPVEADAERRQKRREKPKTKVRRSDVRKAQRAVRRKRKRAPKDRYDRTSYHRAIRYGCEAAFGMPKELRRLPAHTPEQLRAKTPLRAAWHKANGWHPHMIRHRSATDLRKAGGLEAAQVVLGHTDKKTTLIYAEADVQKAHEVIERMG